MALPHRLSMSRRDLLKYGGSGFGYLAFSAFAAKHATGASTQIHQSPLHARHPEFAPHAKRVIFMFMQGGPSQVDTFDYKPELIKHQGQSIEFKYNNKEFKGDLLPPQWAFNQHGTGGLYISELFPHLARHADRLCVLNGMHTDVPAHPQATIFLHTGSANLVRPSMGSWVVYGLGTENENLPGFVTINPVGNQGGSQNYGSAFLPATYQGTRMNAGKAPLENIRNAVLKEDEQRRQLDLIQSLNRGALKAMWQSRKTRSWISL